MICRRLVVCLILQAVFGGGPRLSVQLAAAEAGYWSVTSPLAADKKSAGNVEFEAGAEAGWRLIGGATTGAGKSDAAVLHTPELERSDPRLAGLMVRCDGTQGTETIIVVVEPFSPHAQPQVSLRTPEQTLEFAGSVIPTGAGIRLPLDAVKLAALGLGKARDVEIKVTADGAAINGAVALTGLPKALAWLKGECIQK
jgi:hypothetical protein